MLIYPVRHHSPAASLHLERLIRERRPAAILVEGPADATPLIPLLLDGESVPPLAIYAYRTGESHHAAYYPFCAYSPEYVALRVGQEVGAQLAFCDLPAGATLDWEVALAPAEASRSEGEAGPDFSRLAAALTAAAGFETFEQLWETAFEQEGGRGAAADFVALLADYGGKVRSLDPPARGARDDLREAAMAAAARGRVETGVPAGRILLVCGAAHAEAIEAAFRAERPAPEVSAAPAELALIPFSFPRLSEQRGYGAGNRAPWFYQQVWELHGDYAAATRRGLVVLADHLRGQGQTASLAECIDAFNLAVTLARLRGKPAPGVDELTEASTACLGQGQSARIAAALDRVLVGDAVGRVTSAVGRTPLQAEFYEMAARLRLPILDAPKQVLVHLADPREMEQSVFLHRLRLLDVPFGNELESGLGGHGRAARGGSLEQLSRVREKWELQWTPAVDGMLVERTVWGSTLVEACGRRLDRRLAEAASVDAGTEVLLSLALCDLAGRFGPALERCEGLAADSASFPALARAAYHLDGLLGYGAARKLPTDALGALATRLFSRAVLHLAPAAVCGDDAAVELRERLVALHELVARRSPVASDAAGFWAAVARVAEAAGSHPGVRGLALVLLELGGRLPAGELATRLRYWLSAADEAADNARLVAGLFSLHRGTLVRNRALIGAVTDFLLELDVEQLVPLLPVLRGTLGGLSAAERAYLSETLGSILGIGAGDARRTLTLEPSDAAWLREADEAVAATLAAWETHYGLR